MRKKYRLALVLPIILPFLSIISCSKASQNQNSQTWWDKDITIQVNPGWAWDIKGNAFSNAAKLLEKKVNELKNDDNHDKYSFKNLPNVKVTFDWSTSNSDVIIQNVVTKKHDLGFASITATMNAKQSKIQPLIQTMTNSFKFDKVWKIYKNVGVNKDADLKAIAAAQTALFKSSYNDKNKSWNETVYTNLYDLTAKVDFYRGAIWVFGPNRDKARDAWRNKNWSNFLSAGILHGGSKSGGRFKLQEKLLKKHFGKNAFTTLEEVMQKNPSKFKKAYASEMKNDGAFGIAFDDEGSFAWTKKSSSGTTNFNVSNAEVLVVTEPLKYDVGSFRSNMDPRQARLIATAFVKLIEEAETKPTEVQKTEALSKIYGPNYGYNGYRLINNRKAELEVPYKSVMD